MASAAAEPLSSLVAAAGVFGAIGAYNGYAVIRDVRRRRTRIRGGFIHRDDSPMAFWMLIAVATMLSIISLTVAGGSTYVYASAFIDQGTWPVVQPRRKPASRGAVTG